MIRGACLPLAVVLVLLAPPVPGAEVAAELWDRPRSARTVMAQAAVRQAVAEYQARGTARIIITHGAGQEALLQAEELRAWLAALAVDSRRVQLRAEPAVAVLRIEVTE